MDKCTQVECQWTILHGFVHMCIWVVYVCMMFIVLAYIPPNCRETKSYLWVFLVFSFFLGTDPNKHYISVYRSLAAIWIIFGLVWLALIFNLGADLMEKFLQLNWQKSGPGTAETAVTKLEDNPDQPRIHIPSWEWLMDKQHKNQQVSCPFPYAYKAMFVGKTSCIKYCT